MLEHMAADPNGKFAGRIVVGIDASDAAHAAAHWAAVEAITRGRGLTLTTAILPPTTIGGLGIPPALDFLDALHAEAVDQLTSLADALPGGDIDVHVDINLDNNALVDVNIINNYTAPNNITDAYNAYVVIAWICALSLTSLAG